MQSYMQQFRWMKYSFLCWLVVSSFTTLIAQTEAEQMDRAQNYISKAEDYYAQAEYEASIKEYQFAAAIYRRTNHPEKYGICYNGVGNNYINLTRYKEAFQEFKRVTYLFNELASSGAQIDLDSTILADSYEGFGRYYMNVNVDIEKAMYYHQEALRLRLLYNGDKADIARSYYFLGRSYRYYKIDSSLIEKGAEIVDPVKEELKLLNQALEMQLKASGETDHEVANTLEAIGDYYYSIINDYQKGFEYHQKALKIRKEVFRDNHPKIASSYLNHATYYRVMHLFEKEEEYLENALSIQLDIFGDEHADVAKSYYLLGNRTAFSGDYDKALDYYDRALAIFIQLQTENSVEAAEIYLRNALCYRALNESKEEFNLLQKSLGIHQKVYGKDHYQLGKVYTEIGAYYGARNEYDSLLYYYQMASDLWVEQLGEDHFFVAQSYDNLAKAYRYLQDSEKEYFYLNEALHKKQQTEAINTPEAKGEYVRSDMIADLSFETKAEDDVILGTQLFESYMNLAAFYKRKRDYDIALIYVQNALVAVCKGLDGAEDDIYKNPEVSELAHNIEWLNALEQKGHLFLQLYYATKEPKKLEYAEKTYMQALTLIDTLRINFSSDGSKQQLTRRSIPVYEGTIEVLHTLYNSSKNPKYLYQAFEVMERSKTFVLLQALQGIAARSFSGVPADLLAREEYLRRNLAYYSDFKNRGRKKEEDFDKAYFETRQAYDSLMQLIETQYPRYYNIKYQNTVVGLKKLQSTMLNSQNVLLEYFIGDQNIFVFKVTADYQYFYKIPIPNDLERMVNDLRTALTDYQLIAKDPNLAYKNFVLASHSFYKTFVLPFLTGVDKSVTQLIIVPDGWMSYIPFEILLEEVPANLDNPDYKSLKYLLQRYEVNYSYSATLLVENMEPIKQKNNSLCLGFAPSYSGSKVLGAEAELPWAEKELKAVEETFKGKYFFGTKASKERFQEMVQDYGIIHLAMHGIVNIRNPHKSMLLFALDSTQTEDQAKLFAYEIHNMSLNADLVVLSACETGFGKVVRGEGVLSLARAFMYAGVPSVVTTLWKVNDYTSATLMTYFYENLAAGMTKPQALRMAKLKYLEQSDKVSGHPAFWGSFVTIGNPEALHYGFPAWVWTTMMIGAVLLLGMIIFTFFTKGSKRKKNQTSYPQRASNLPPDASL
jgi:CHAT domain-containing protein/tetratricopeptide (TPR) repeat protein